jgi:hypothetical protein
MNYVTSEWRPVEQADVETRATFLARTYIHLFGAIAAFVIIETLLFATGFAYAAAQRMGQSWLLVLGGFMIVSWFASKVAYQSKSLPKQYLALGGFVLAEALLFAPLLVIAERYGQGVIGSAALVTMIGFTALTMIVFVSRKDFSFLGGILKWAMFLAIGAIAGHFLFGFQLGTWFMVGMVGVAGAAILFDTSKVMHHMPEDRYVAGALELFASVALLFWYLLMLFMRRD